VIERYYAAFNRGHCDGARRPHRSGEHYYNLQHWIARVAG